MTMLAAMTAVICEDAGHLRGRIDTLRLAYIGAACAEVMYEVVSSVYDRKPHYDPEFRDLYDFTAYTAGETALAILDTLCTLGDEAAIAIRGER